MQVVLFHHDFRVWDLILTSDYCLCDVSHVLSVSVQRFLYIIQYPFTLQNYISTVGDLSTQNFQ